MARARDNTIAHVSVEKERRVRGIDMEKSPWKKRGTRKKLRVSYGIKFSKGGVAQKGTSYNNSEWA
jgi:hypothetical protein